MKEKGNISIHTENIFPIIKKFLYSDHEIFLRELVSNAVDATQKLKKLSSIGEFKGELGELKVKVALNEEKKTITISDNGIGMTAEEIKKYINQIAFSGATEFLEKYKDKGETAQVIGHFGLGFYSAFMVAEKVEIHTLSHQEGAEAAKWECDGSTEFTISKGKRKERGTDIILYLAKDSEEFAEKIRIQTILDKYCKFLPVEVEFDEKVVNTTNPIWVKNPQELKDEDYLAFYKQLYPFTEDPLFWIHLNVDYPFNLTGILYFPKVKNNFDMHRNKIQLYSKQVFITDEVKDVVPEFLMLLHGVLDSPDIPLNVSRSFLQADSNVKKINTHITKKVADKLEELFKKDRTAFEQKWDDISVFVKYGMLSDEKFYEKANNFCLLCDTENKYYTIEEYKTQFSVTQKDKNDNTVLLYTSDATKQHSYIESANNRAYNVVKLDGPLDSHFVSLIERKHDKFTLKRVDSDSIEKLIEKNEKIESVLSKEEEDKVKELFQKTLDNKNITVTVEAMPATEMPVSITLPEFMRRMKEMSAMNGGMAMMGNMPDMYNLVVNGNNPAIRNVLNLPTDEEKTVKIKQYTDLALLSQGMLSGAALTNFIKRSVELV